MKAKYIGISALAAVLIFPSLSATAAAAEAPEEGDTLHLTYAPPDIAPDSSGVTWKWTLVNKGEDAASDVKLTHTFRPKQEVQDSSESCTKEESKVACDYGTLEAGQKTTGWIKADLPETTENVQIDGQVKWKEGSGIETLGGEPGSADAGDSDADEPDADEPDADEPDADEPDAKDDRAMPSE